MSGHDDWRITEGPAIGIEPEFALSDVELTANFFVTGTMSRAVTAKLTTATPTRVESVDRLLSEFAGRLHIFDSHPNRSYPGLYPGHFDSIELGEQRGALALLAPNRFAVHLYLPADQFAALLPLVTSSGMQLRIEVERTIDQGLPDEQAFFWNDRVSPVILFNEFRIAA